MALIPPFFIDCVVAIGTENSSGNRIWIASGFIYGHFLSKIDENVNNYQTYLVTNRHVISNLNKIFLRFNPETTQAAKEYEFTSEWTCHPNPAVDVAVARMNTKKLQDHGIKFDIFRSEQNIVFVKQMNDMGVVEGDFIYALGFPMGLVGKARNSVIVRSGTIAYIQGVFSGEETQFLNDVLIFPGNSGGPVILKPEVYGIEGTKQADKAYLIGIVTSYVPYEDIAYSLQTTPPTARVSFQENSGLSLAHPIDYVHEAILEHIKKIESTKI